MNNKDDRGLVRGYSAYGAKANILVRVFAFIVDTSLVLILISLPWFLWRLSKIVDPSWLLAGSIIMAAILAIIMLGIEALRGVTPGKLVWGTRVENRKVIQQEHLTLGGLVRASFLTLGILTLSIFVVEKTILTHPLLIAAVETRLQPFSAEEEKATEWTISPFFYAMGAWPKTFSGTPVFYTLPYEKGPPAQFVGQVDVRLDPPETKLVIEGPRTPILITRTQLKTCLTSSPIALIGIDFWDCLRVRRSVLSRHIKEAVQFTGQATWQVKWFRVENPALPENEKPEGFYISADGESLSEERFVLVTGTGVHQALVLDHNLNQKGVQAERVFEQIVRSLRVSENLAPGKALANRLLMETTLNDLRKDLSDEVMSTKFAQILMVLSSKISVEPQNVEPYYHLASTAMLLDKFARKTNSLEFSSIAKGLIQSAYRYSQDIAPNESKSIEIQAMWIETK